MLLLFLIVLAIVLRWDFRLVCDFFFIVLTCRLLERGFPDFYEAFEFWMIAAVCVSVILLPAYLAQLWRGIASRRHKGPRNHETAEGNQRSTRTVI